MSDFHEQDEILLASLAGLLGEKEPELDGRARMRAALMAKVHRPRTVITRTDEGQWTPIMPGVRVKLLHRDLTDAAQTALWRMEPGSTVAAHGHSHDEECLVIEGSIIEDGIEYFPGDFLLAQAGFQHKQFESPRGALLLIRGELLADAD